ncbi:LysR substrate-binding domain-containing protein [Actinoplanes sp. TRM 88003]|uniref:LysR substrate-binding domain-containing protein n=1 Tax=Paractinoplanes aksuensis TaxID=2939490 RepID=A0ABT1DJH2_9ACTN|nr:LysR substrate-binding domain-containing protein [Actinoplanes aksuensis]MCO8270205.1 LysR substrate-binding domain-containing protein [Actinoplanes aksuensis]
MVDPGQLRLLALIRAHGSLAGAAHELRVTPAAVSGQVARAESDWGTALVVRGPRGARLTGAGAILADAGDAVVALGERAEQQFRAAIGSLSRRLRIGTFQAAAEHLLPPALTALRHQRPDAELTIIEIPSHRGLPMVAEGELDVAVIATYGEPPAGPAGVRRQPLLTDPMVLCLPDDHRLARRRRLRLADLADEPWIVIVAGHAARRQLDEAAGFTPRVQFETENYNVAQALVGTGIGVTLLSRLTVRPTPGAVHRELDAPRLSREIAAVTAGSDPLAAHFVALLGQVGADLSEAWADCPFVDDVTRT